MLMCRRSCNTCTFPHKALGRDSYTPQRLTHLPLSLSFSASSAAGNGSGSLKPKAQIPSISSLCSTLWSRIDGFTPRAPAGQKQSKRVQCLISHLIIKNIKKAVSCAARDRCFCFSRDVSSTFLSLFFRIKVTFELFAKTIPPRLT